MHVKKMHSQFKRNITLWIIKTVLQRYWRFMRGATLGGQAVVLNSKNEILLIRHTYQPGWHFPGGGVEFCETCEDAMKREVFEETGVIVTGDTKLHGIFANFRIFPGDHIALYIVKNWEQPTIPESTREIAEQGFFSYKNLPDGVAPGTRKRLSEIFENTPISKNWL